MNPHVKLEPKTYGVLAEFLTPEDVVAAAKAAHAAGWRHMDAYSPFPVDGLAEAIGFTKNRIPMVVLIGGILGALGGFWMQWYTSVHDYPLNISGKPFNSWPAFIPITFETTILFAAFACVLGMLGLNGLPRPHHPVFNAPGFALASRSRFFLCLQHRDPKFTVDAAREFLQGLNPREITVVPNY